LTLPTNFKDRQFVQTWSSHIKELLEDREAQAVLKQQFSITKDIRSLHRLLAIPVCSLSQDHPFIEPKDLVDAQTKLGVDCKAAMLCGTATFLYELFDFFVKFLYSLFPSVANGLKISTCRLISCRET